MSAANALSVANALGIVVLFNELDREIWPK
jgi:hypothetical protein